MTNRSIAITIFTINIFMPAVGGAVESKFAGVTYPKSPDSFISVNAAPIEKIAEELKRPCDEKEVVSWRSTRPKVEEVYFVSFMMQGLEQSYLVSEVTESSNLAQRVGAKVFAANTTGRDRYLTVVSSTSVTEVVVAICGGRSALGTDVTPSEPPTVSGKGWEWVPMPTVRGKQQSVGQPRDKVPPAIKVPGNYYEMPKPRT